MLCKNTVNVDTLIKKQTIFLFIAIAMFKNRKIPQGIKIQLVLKTLYDLMTSALSRDCHQTLNALQDGDQMCHLHLHSSLTT